MVLWYLAIEIFECIKGINPAYPNEMFTRKKMSLCIVRQLSIGKTESETHPIRSLICQKLRRENLEYFAHII